MSLHQHYFLRIASWGENNLSLRCKVRMTNDFLSRLEHRNLHLRLLHMVAAVAVVKYERRLWKSALSAWAAYVRDGSLRTKERPR